MKSLIILLSMAVIVTACSRHTAPAPLSSYMAIAVINDRTDPHLLQPEPESILQLYNLQDNKAAANWYRYQAITDLTLSPTVELGLPDEEAGEKQNTQDLPMCRERQIIQFYDSIRGQLRSVTAQVSDTITMAHSECFKTIAASLQWLKSKPAEKHVLLTYSDLQENSSICRAYTENFKRLLAKKPEAVIKQFDKTQLLPDSLQGISVFFCYQPKDRQADATYNNMVQVYKTMLERRGATVHIQANNNHYDLP
ncbi:MAG: hypothetical protein JST86_09470 [Bacteroidetes bacterium]|nr:hypothetical protein [Bacteroidota bacterium]